MSHFHHHASDQAPETKGLVLHWAGSYDSMTNLHPAAQPEEHWLLAQVKAGDQVLDVGCGSGRLTLAAQAVGRGRRAGYRARPVARDDRGCPEKCRPGWAEEPNSSWAWWKTCPSRMPALTWC